MSQGFDRRVVSYEYIHSITPEDFEKIIDVIDPQKGDVILDAMCGYGAVSKGILSRESEVELYLNDESTVQINRAMENLPQLDKDRFDTHPLPENNYPEGCFDKIVIKMGLHEVSLDTQKEILREFYRLLKQAGKVIVWDIMLNDQNQTLFQDIIRKKDELAGYDQLTTERYFFREDEFLDNVMKANFGKIIEAHTIPYRFSSKRRLDQEFGGDENKLARLNDFIRQRFTPELKSALDFGDAGDDVQFTIVKKIFSLEK